MFDLKLLEGWMSDKVAGEYVQNSLLNQTKIGNLIITSTNVEYWTKLVRHQNLLRNTILHLQSEKKENKTGYMLEYFLSRIEKFIDFEMMKYLDTSVRTWPKITGDIITDASKAERIFYRCPDITHYCPEYRSSILKRQMSWKLYRNACDIDHRCLDIIDRWIVLIFYLVIC